MRTVLALATLLLSAAVPALADVTYDFVPTGFAAGAGPADFTGNPFPTNFFTVTDGVVAGGAMDFTVACPGLTYNCPQPWPDYFLKGLVGVSGVLPGATSGFAAYPVDITFNPDGTLSGVFDIVLDQDELVVRGSGRNWSGEIGSDVFDGGPVCDGLCTVTGYWITTDHRRLPMPEPPGLALLLPALAATLRLRRGRRGPLPRM
jgi:hypothetical protein